jgi:hypothetical protein
LLWRIALRSAPKHTTILSTHRSEALPLGGWAYTEAPLKEAAKNFGAGKAATHGDGLKSLLTILKSAPRAIEARAFDERAGRYSHFPLKITRETPRAHI